MAVLGLGARVPHWGPDHNHGGQRPQFPEREGRLPASVLPNAHGSQLGRAEFGDTSE